MKEHTKVAVKTGEYLDGIINLEDFPHGDMVDFRRDDRYDIEFYSVPDGVTVPSYDPELGDVRWMQVKYWSVHRGKKLEIVTLSDGSQIYTDDDPRAIYGVALDADTLVPERFTPSEALRRGVLVPIATAPVFDIPGDVFYDFSDGMLVSDPGERRAKVGFDFGQFVGLMAGDGWHDVAGQTYIADNEGYNAAFVRDFLQGVYGNVIMKEYVGRRVDDPSRYGDTKRYRISVGTLSLGTRVGELVDGHGDENTSGSANKRLPLWYQFAGREFALGLVNGMIATDGTVAVSNGKDKPQLQIQFFSTSLNLCREFQRCCRILGCRCSVQRSRMSSGGNKTWLCIVSTVDAKRVGLLSRCCNVRKRDAFENTEVSSDQTYVRNDSLPFPKRISEELVALIPAVKYRETAEDRELYNLCLNVRARAKEGEITRYLVRRAAEVGERIASASAASAGAAAAALDAIRTSLESLVSSGAFRSRRDTHVEVDVSVADVLRDGVKACQTRTGDKKVAGKQLKMLYNVRTKGFMTSAQADGLAGFFSSVSPNSELKDSPALAEMMRLAESPVRWERIEGLEKTGEETIGYDLTVPGYDTFVNADGVVLSNTMNFHVPASDKAVREAVEKMMPSKNLFSLTDLRKPRFVPNMEMTLGLAKLTAPASKSKPRVFVTAQDAIRAYRRGEIGANDPVSVLRT